MALIDAARAAKHIEPGLNTLFHKTVKEAPSAWRQVAEFVRSDQPSEDYAWLGHLPAPREFVDERQVKALDEYDFTITNLPWETTIGVRRETLEDERYGQIEARVRGMGISFNKWFDEKIFGLLDSGDTATAYDGQNFFDTDHSSGDSGTQSNKSTNALSLAEYTSARATMMNYKDDQGRVLGIMPNLLVTGPSLEQTSREITGSTLTETGSAGAAIDNVMSGTAQSLVTPYITDTNNWYLLDTQSYLKPLITQERTGLELGFQGEDSHVGFHTNTFEYGAYWRGNFGYGRWEYAFGGVVA